MLFKKVENIPIESFIGQVIDVQKSAETRVHGEGGGGYVVSVKVDSTVTQDLQIFLQDEQGNERHIQVTNWDFPVRVGNQVEAVLVCSCPIILRNKNLGSETRSYKDLKELCKALYFHIKIYGILSLFSFFILMIVIAPLLGISTTVVNYLGVFAVYGGVLAIIFYMLAWRITYFGLKSKLKGI